MAKRNGFFELFNIAEDVAKDIVMMYEIGQIQILIISIITYCKNYLQFPSLDLRVKTWWSGGDPMVPECSLSNYG